VEEEPHMEISWAIIGVILGILIGAGVGMLGLSPPEFIVARACFLISAVLLGAMSFVWQIHTNQPTWWRITAGVALWLCIGIGLPESMRLVSRRQSTFEKPPQTGNAVVGSRPVRIVGLFLEPIVLGRPITLIVRVVNDSDATVKIISKYTAGWVENLPLETEHFAIDKLEDKVWNQLGSSRSIIIGDSTSDIPAALSLPPKLEVNVTDPSLVIATREIIQMLNNKSGLYFCGTFTQESASNVTRFCVRIDKHRDKALSLCRNYN
jgi:hypothetical protein